MKSNILNTLRTLVLPMAIAVGAGLFVRTTVVQTFSIPSSSMSPTLEPGDNILVTPYRGLFPARPARGQVIVFRRPGDGGQFFVKRIVGMPGESIEVRDGRVFIDGRPLESDFGSGWIEAEQRHTFLGDREYFVMGDNRRNSIDSRTWGPLRAENIVGQARVIFWSAWTSDSESSANASPMVIAAPHAIPVRWNRLLKPIR